MTDITQHQAPRVTPESIDALMATMRYTTTRTPNSASTTATASLPWGYVVATASSGCLDSGSFDEATSRKLAIAEAAKKAREALWDREAYRISYELAHHGGEGA